MATVKINGKDLTVDDGTLILNAARDAGFEIPTFCYQADLAGLGSCRMCLIEIEGQKKLQPSCVTPVMDGMSIMTDSETVQDARASMLEFLLSNHALDCPVCDKAGECELQDMVFQYGPRSGRHAENKRTHHDRDYRLSPVIVKNSNRCVQCVKCVRVCDEIVGVSVLGSLGRGEGQEETSFLRTELDCDHCGNCIEVCPVGCFMRAPYRYKARPWDLKGADTVCNYCATGCRMVVEHRDGELVRSRAQHGVGINSQTLCARGRFGYDTAESEDRVTKPLLRRLGGFEEVSWEEALAEIRSKLHPGSRTGGIASARLTNEELYLFGRFMRDVIKTPNVDSTSRFNAAGVMGFIEAARMDSGGVSIFDAMNTDALMVVGTQLSDENPVTDYIVRRLSAEKYMSVIIASPRAMKLDKSADVTLRHEPAGEASLLASLAASMGGAQPVAAAGLTTDELSDAAARLRGSETVSIIAGTEFLRCPEGTVGLKALVSALEALGMTVTVVPALDRCNQRGAWEMGVHPGLAPGYAPAPELGLCVNGMVDAAIEGKLDTMYLAGADLVTMYPDEARVREALSKLNFLVVQSPFLTETARLANVVLPGACSIEKAGTFTNQEGRVQAISRVIDPPGEAKSDLDILTAVARLFNPGFGGSSDAVFEEIRREVSIYSGVSLAFDNKRNKKDHLDIKEALVVASESRVTVPEGAIGAAAHSGAGSERDFVLTTGNHLFHSGHDSTHSEILGTISKPPSVEISDDDAERLGLADGTRVKVAGEAGDMVLTLATRKGSRSGVAFIAENYPGLPVSRFFTKGAPLPRVSITRA
jgi:NADH-quinone oxidoreductase subunit G